METTADQTMQVDSALQMQVDKTVTKRDGQSQTLQVTKLRTRLERLLDGLAHKHINLDIILNKVISYA